MGVSFFGAPAGIRTPDTLLKRQVLCLLSYWGVVVRASSGSSRFAARPLKIKAASRASILYKAIGVVSASPQLEAQRSGFELERKKESADMEFSRLLRKPRKRNGADFF